MVDEQIHFADRGERVPLFDVGLRRLVAIAALKLPIMVFEPGAGAR